MAYNSALLVADLLLVILMAAFVFFAWRSNPEFRGAREFFVAFSCAAVNIVLFVSGPLISRSVNTLILQTLLICTGIFCYVGCRRYAEPRKIEYSFPIAVLIGSIAVSGYFLIVHDNALFGFVMSSSVTGAFCLVASRTLWRDGFAAHPVRHGLSLAILAHGTFMILRPLLFSAPATSFISTHLLITSMDLILFQQIVTTPVLGLSILLLINEDNAHLLKVSAEFDSLTQARNRGSFLTCLNKAASLSSRLRKPLTILTIDLDYFKSINDKFGHHAGDAILASFADIARSCLRQEDELGRIGGEEFAIYLVNTSVDQALLIAERLRASIEATPVHIGGDTIHYSASIGVASYDEKLGIDRILVCADRALYAAKHKGRNRVELGIVA